MPFDTTTAETAKKEIAEAEKKATMAGYIAMAKKAGLWLLALLVLFIAFKRRPKRPMIETTASDLPPAQGLLIPAGAPAGALDAGGMTALTAQPQVSAERMRQEVASLVDNQPADVAQMLQGWLDERKV